MAFCNSLEGTMNVVLFHGSLNKLTFKLDRKQVFNNSNFDFKIFSIRKVF
jgi:hypothetical protein